MWSGKDPLEILCGRCRLGGSAEGLYLESAAMPKIALMYLVGLKIVDRVHFLEPSFPRHGGRVLRHRAADCANNLGGGGKRVQVP